MTGEARLSANCWRPFANGTEERAWQAKWCAYCVHDHSMHNDTGSGCDLYTDYLVFDRWPEPWLPEPDDGEFFLPSRLICQQFRACTKGDCTGDPGAEPRAERVAEVIAYWRSAAEADR